MKLIVCTDSRGGVSFFGRRIASDRLVTLDIMRESAGGRLLIAPYSEGIFKRALEFLAEDSASGANPASVNGSADALPYIISDDPLTEGEDGDTVFIEDRPTRPYLDKIDSIVIYNLNLPYPFDKKLDIEPRADGFELTEVTEFPGNSHDIVTKNVFRRAL